MDHSPANRDYTKRPEYEQTIPEFFISAFRDGYQDTTRDQPEYLEEQHWDVHAISPRLPY
jgi:hypothetical protein